jgi:hypothetical protein
VNKSPSQRLTQIINTLDVELEAIGDPAQRAALAHEVSERGRMIQTVAGPIMRSAVRAMREGGASHAQVAAHLGVTRGRAQQLTGIPVRLVGGPKDGQTLPATPQGNGQPNRQLLVAVQGGTAALNYSRRLDPEPDGSWAADFYPGTRVPDNWIKDLTT